MEALLDARPHRREGAGGDGVLTDAPYLLVLDGERHKGARIAYRWIADHRSFVSRVTGIGRSRTLDA